MSAEQDAFIPFARPDVGDDEARAVADTVRSGWLTSGPQMLQFEREFAEHMGGEVDAITVSSATAGLHLALESLGIGPGDEVIVPTWTFTATAEVVRYLGATPIIVDVESSTLNISAESAANAVTRRTRAVIPVHFAGLPVDLLNLRAAMGSADIKIIEDAAHALPSSGATGLVGNGRGSDATVFSFYANKPVTTGEGGMVTTLNSEVAARARVMRLHGIDRSAFDRYTSTHPSWRYDVVAPGFKYNMPDTAAAIGRVQLRRSAEMHSRRTQIARHYLDSFSNLPMTLPLDAGTGDVHSWHLFVVRLAEEANQTRDEFIQALGDAGIGTSVHYIPLHEHSYWKAYVSDAVQEFPHAVSASPAAASLPLSSSLTDTEVQRVVDAVKNVLS